MAPKLYKWPTDPPGKAASHTIDYGDHQDHVKLTGFTPTPAPVSPPPGTYDPGLDAALRANNRGVFDLQQDTERDNQRADTTHTAGVEQANTQRGWSLADLLAGHNRETQDYGTNTATLQRNYANLGSAQTAKASSGAFVDTGSIQAASGARTENQGRDQSVLDTAHSRAEEDYNTGVDRTNKTADWQVAGLDEGYQYGVDDRATSLARATREGSFFGQDTAGAKMYQATSSGLYTPPQKASNEFSDGKGPYKLVVAHGLRYKVRPNGSREPAGVAR